MTETIDLHVHSNCSDGSLTPEELVCYAIEKGLKAFALTDHDTMEGVPRAQKAAQGCEIEVIPGIELSTEFHGKDIHIVGLGLDYADMHFQEELMKFQNSRDARNEKMAARLQEEGIAVSLEELEEEYPNAVLTRAHFAGFLLERGYVKSRSEAFDRYLGDHACCFVPREKVTPYQAIRLIHTGGGVAVLAHPLLYGMSMKRLEESVAEFKGQGLDAIEAVYSTNKWVDESNMKQLAKRHGLLISGGSDYHGKSKPDIDLGVGRGNLNIPYRIWERLKERL